MTSAARTDRAPEEHLSPAGGSCRALLPVGLIVGGLAVALLVQQVFDPFRTDIPLCIVYHLTGLHCPGCGAIRSVHALLDGDVLLALRSNAMIITALPVLAVALGRWALHRAQGRPVSLPPTWAVLSLVALALAFAVARNLPMFWFLAPVSYVGA